MLDQCDMLTRNITKILLDSGLVDSFPGIDTDKIGGLLTTKEKPNYPSDTDYKCVIYGESTNLDSTYKGPCCKVCALSSVIPKICFGELYIEN